MKCYRDAIYYTEEGQDREHIKKEIIAGDVLFPGRIPLDALVEKNKRKVERNLCIRALTKQSAFV